MPLIDPNHPLADLLERDQRYSLDAYLFVLEALSFAQESLGMGEQEKSKDVQAAREKKKSEILQLLTINPHRGPTVENSENPFGFSVHLVQSRSLFARID